MNIILSCTTLKSRLHVFSYAVQSLLTQSLKPDLFLLNVSEEAFEDASEVMALLPGHICKNEISINLTKDVGPHTKLIPALHHSDEGDLIITVDDDVLYSQNLIERLVHCSSEHPNSICCARARRITKNVFGRYMNYHRWPNAHGKVAGVHLLPLGVGGISYRKRLLDIEFLLNDEYQTLAPTTDDLWFRAASLIKGTEVYVDNDIDMGSMPIRHQLGLQLININQGSTTPSEKSFVSEVVNKVYSRTMDYWGINQSQNDLQWDLIIDFARKQGKPIAL